MREASMKRIIFVAVILMSFWAVAQTATNVAYKKKSTQVKSTTQAQNTSAWACLPADIKPDEVVSVQVPKNTKVTVAQKLKEIGAKCNAKGQLVNAKGRPIYLYHLTGCWGMAPANRDEILANQARK